MNLHLYIVSKLVQRNKECGSRNIAWEWSWFWRGPRKGLISLAPRASDRLQLRYTWLSVYTLLVCHIQGLSRDLAVVAMSDSQGEPWVVKCSFPTIKSHLLIHRFTDHDRDFYAHLPPWSMPVISYDIVCQFSLHSASEICFALPARSHTYLSQLRTLHTAQLRLHTVQQQYRLRIQQLRLRTAQQHKLVDV